MKRLLHIIAMFLLLSTLTAKPVPGVIEHDGNLLVLFEKGLTVEEIEQMVIYLGENYSIDLNVKEYDYNSSGIKKLGIQVALDSGTSSSFLIERLFPVILGKYGFYVMKEGEPEFFGLGRIDRTFIREHFPDVI